MSDHAEIIDIRTQVSALLEDGLRTKIVIPLISSLGAEFVEDRHGPDENGKDVFFCCKNILGDYKHCCFVLKAGNITKSGRNDIRGVFNQIDEAIERTALSPIDHKSVIQVEEVILLFNGTMNEPAKEELENKLRNYKYSILKILNVDKLTVVIRNFLDEYSYLVSDYVFEVETFPDFCNQVIARIDNRKQETLKGSRRINASKGEEHEYSG